MKEQTNHTWRAKLKSLNYKRFGFFLFIASVFLFLSKFSETYTQTIQLKVELSGLADEVTIEKDSMHTLEAVIQAKGFNLLPYIFTSKPLLYVDTNTYTSKSSNYIVLDVKNNKHLVSKMFSSSVDVLSVKPDTLWFKFDTMTSKKVPIELVDNINYATGFNVLGHLKLDPDSVKLVGSSSKIAQISSVKTKPFQLENVSESINEKLEIETEDRDITILPNTITLSGIVKRFTEGTINRPIELINAPLDKKLNYFPKSVDIIYYVDLDSFKNVNAKDFKVVADYSKLKESQQNYLELSVLNNSSIVKNVRISQNRIEFIILE